MAKRYTPPPPRESRSFTSTAEIDRAIGKLRRRADDVRALLTDHVPSADARVDVVERSVREAVREIFGPNSPEFGDYEYFRINNGPAYINRPSSFYQRQFEEHVPGAVTLIEGLIRGLEEKREELAEPEAAPRVVFAGREFPPSVVTPRVTDLYTGGHYAEAVFEAAKALVQSVKDVSGSTLDGAPLMRAVFSVNTPIVAFNDRADETDRAEQEGMMHLFEGAALAIRNPGAHRPGNVETPERALRYLEFLSLLADRLHEARPTRS